jgi:hypothetical protein
VLAENGLGTLLRLNLLMLVGAGWARSSYIVMAMLVKGWGLVIDMTYIMMNELASQLSVVGPEPGQMHVACSLPTCSVNKGNVVFVCRQSLRIASPRPLQAVGCSDLRCLGPTPNSTTQWCSIIHVRWVESPHSTANA